MKKIKFQADIMTVSSLGDYLQCHPSTIYRLLKERKLPAFKVGSDWRFQRAQVDQWIQKEEIPVIAPKPSGVMPAEERAARGKMPPPTQRKSKSR